MQLVLKFLFFFAVLFLNSEAQFFHSIADLKKYKNAKTLNNLIQLEFNRSDIMCIGCNDMDSRGLYWLDNFICSTTQIRLYPKILHLQNGTLQPKIKGPLSVQFFNISVVHKHGNMTVIPINICIYSSIVEIDFSYNNIENIETISCFQNLDTAILKHNKVKSIHKYMFHGMRFIRKIDLSHNRLIYIEPGFVDMNKGLLEFDVSYNLLTTIDITNILRRQTLFCKSDFSHNLIKIVTNKLNWTCISSELSAFGIVDFSNNKFTEFAKFREIGFNKYCIITVLNWILYLNNNAWNCDCNLYELAKALEIMLVMKYGAPVAGNMFIRCHSPNQLQGRIFGEIVSNGDSHLFVCNISMSEKCPSKCQCIYKPGIDNSTIVNCSQQGLYRIPPEFPEYVNLQIDLSNNKITTLEVRNQRMKQEFIQHSERIQIMNLQNNSIQFLPVSVYNFKNIKRLDLSFNPIVSIPRSLQILNPCQVVLGTVTINCKCEDIWLKEWLPFDYQKCFNNSNILCTNNGLLLPIRSMNKKDLGCRTPHIYISSINNAVISLLVTILVTSGALYTFRFELTILMRSLMKCLLNPTSHRHIKYDIYISCNDADTYIRHWLTLSLVPYLEGQGHKVYLPYRDAIFGNSHEIEITDAISKSRVFIIVLSDCYHGNTWTWVQKEWKYAWCHYKRDLATEIIIVNYDMMKHNEITKQYLGGFIRLRKFIDFSNFKHSIEREICYSLRHK